MVRCMISRFESRWSSDPNPRVCVLRRLSDLRHPVDQLLQTVGRNVQTLNRVRGKVLGVDSEDKGPRVLPVLVHHCTNKETEGSQC